MATLLGGCVFKNNSGDISMIVCKKESIATDPCMVEALGVRQCLQLARDQGLQKLEIQTDALVIADCISGKSSNANLDPIIVDCVEYLNTFVSASVCYISRENNGEAHKLVGIAKLVGLRNGWGLSQTILMPYCQVFIFLYLNAIGLPLKKTKRFQLYYLNYSLDKHDKCLSINMVWLCFDANGFDISL